jgi:hypothetical protein
MRLPARGPEHAAAAQKSRGAAILVVLNLSGHDRDVGSLNELASYFLLVKTCFRRGKGQQCRISRDWTHLISSEWDHPISSHWAHPAGAAFRPSAARCASPRFPGADGDANTEWPVFQDRFGPDVPRSWLLCHLRGSAFRHHISKADFSPLTSQFFVALHARESWIARRN